MYAADGCAHLLRHGGFFQGAFDAYTARTQYEEKRKYQARWKALFALRNLMASKDGRPLGAPPIRLAGGDRYLVLRTYQLCFSFGNCCIHGATGFRES